MWAKHKGKGSDLLWAQLHVWVLLEHKQGGGSHDCMLSARHAHLSVWVRAVCLPGGIGRRLTGQTG